MATEIPTFSSGTGGPIIRSIMVETEEGPIRLDLAEICVMEQKPFEVSLIGVPSFGINPFLSQPTATRITLTNGCVIWSRGDRSWFSEKQVKPKIRDLAQRLWDWANAEESDRLRWQSIFLEFSELNADVRSFC